MQNLIINHFLPVYILHLCMFDPNEMMQKGVKAASSDLLDMQCRQPSLAEHVVSTRFSTGSF